MAGTPRKVTLDGQTFNVAADADFAQNPGQEVEGIRHTGGTTFKTTLMVESVESVDLILDGFDFAELKDMSTRIIPMSYEEESGDVYRATGKFSLGARQTSDTKASLTLIPDGEWEPFLVG